jgi:hypothetical protein
MDSNNAKNRYAKDVYSTHPLHIWLLDMSEAVGIPVFFKPHFSFGVLSTFLATHQYVGITEWVGNPSYQAFMPWDVKQTMVSTIYNIAFSRKNYEH